MTAPSVIGSAALAALPGSVVPDGTVGVAVDARHVLGVGGVVDRSTARLAALIDPGFLAGAGWDTASRVLSVPPGHPLLGWSVCQTARCTNQVYGGHRTCGACRAGQDDPLADDTGVAEPA